MITMWKKNWVL